MIREATSDDIAGMVALGRLMRDESPRFRARSWRGDKVAGTIMHLIENPDGLALVDEVDGLIVGAFVGMVSADWFGDDRTACDLALYVMPGLRGTRTGLRLIRRYREWARLRGAVSVMIGTTTGVETDVAVGLYRLAGAVPCGHCYEFPEN